MPRWKDHRRLLWRPTVTLLVASTAAAQSVAVPSFVVPHFADLTIATRRADGHASTISVLRLKGARQRSEPRIEPERRPFHDVTITQCDARRSVHLNTDARLYAISLFEDWSEHLKRLRPVPEPYGADVTTIFDTVDTGQRRALGSYVLRRVKATITVEPSPGANTRASRREVDGWYIELPGLGCSNAETTAYLSGEVIPFGGARDRHHVKTLGRARRGYPIEETDRSTEEGRTSVTRIDLVEFSERALEPALFEIPSGYRPALRLPAGGYDLTRPDTILNRLQTYWDEATDWLRRIL